jgi:lysozyme
MALHLSDHGASFISNFEGFRADAYWDVDHWSIGYGTRARSQHERGVSRAEALRRLHDHVEDHVGPWVREVRPFGQHQFDALASFAYNLGAGVLEGQVGDAVRRGDYRLAGDAMLNYTKAGGEVLQGLVRRREAERRLLLKVRYTARERDLLGIVRFKGTSAPSRARAVEALRTQAREIQERARAEGDWQKHDRGRRYQGLRRAIRKYG